MALHALLKAARLQAGISQMELGKVLGLSNASVSRMESGQTAITLDVAEAWANACGRRLAVTEASVLHPEQRRLLAAIENILPHLSPADVRTLWLLIDGWDASASSATSKKSERAAGD